MTINARIFKIIIGRFWQFASMSLLLVLCISVSADAPRSELLSFDELIALYEQPRPTDVIETKLERLLTTPFVVERRDSPEPQTLQSSQMLGEFLRVVHWNIQRGLEFEAIRLVFEGGHPVSSLVDDERFPPNSKKRRELIAQVQMLRSADIVVLNEVDWGLKRTGYRNVTADLARELGMSYAFGLQFIELSPIHITRRAAPEDADEAAIKELIGVDEDRYLGLHGLAILSRLPLTNVRLVPFKAQPYDWYGGEKRGPSFLEKGKRGIARTVFQEKVLREVRLGGRTTLYADVIDERLPMGRVTIAATHLESRTSPSGRLEQVDELLEEIRGIQNPVVLAGDLNTSSSDMTPTSLQRELTLRFGNPRFWLRTGIQRLFGIGMNESILLTGVTLGRRHADPTARGIPIISANAERRLFDRLKKFRFDDGGSFDFRGDRERSVGSKKGILANSNQRSWNGFVTTYQVERPLMFIGKYKLDWIFVKPAETHVRSRSYRFAPHFGRTLDRINELIPGRISDHHPLMVELPIGEPLINGIH